MASIRSRRTHCIIGPRRRVEIENCLCDDYGVLTLESDHHIERKGGREVKSVMLLHTQWISTSLLYLAPTIFGPVVVVWEKEEGGSERAAEKVAFVGSARVDHQEDSS